MKNAKVENLHKKIFTKINCHFAIAGLTLCASILLSILFFNKAYERIIQSHIDFGTSTAFYFQRLCNIDFGIVATVAQIPQSVDVTISVLPRTVDLFGIKMEMFWHSLFYGETVQGYGGTLLNGLFAFSQILLIVAPLIAIVALLLFLMLSSKNKNYNKDSVFLKAYKRCVETLIVPIKNEVVSFYKFLKTQKVFLYSIICVWLLSFNIVTIIIEFVAFVLYFAVSFDVANIYVQFQKLLADLSCFASVPLFVWIIVFVLLFNKLRKKLAIKKLKALEKKNEKFIEDLPNSTMFVGPPGADKTKTLTDMALSLEVYFRKKAYELMYKNMSRFPNFPWINFERDLMRAYLSREIFNLATIKIYVDSKKQKFNELKTKENCYDYDFKKYGLKYNNALWPVDLFDVLEAYAKEFFIYASKTALTIGNFSIRHDNELKDNGNLPVWDTSFFNKQVDKFEKNSYYSHILDFDLLRLGRRMNEDKTDILEFGIVTVAEIAKERGNKFDMVGKKKDSNIANQKNDLTNLFVKMSRHPSTVDYFYFFRFLCDDQRAESLNADARELCDIIHLETVSKSDAFKSALPFSFFDELLHSIISKLFNKFYKKYRFKRADNTLFYYLFKKVATAVERRQERIVNLYYYKKAKIKQEHDCKNKSINYFLMFQKIYSDRYTTDCFGEYFVEKAKNNSVGLSEILSYETSRPKWKEMKQQDSYFINDLDMLGKYDANDVAPKKKRTTKRN